MGSILFYHFIICHKQTPKFLISYEASDLSVYLVQHDKEYIFLLIILACFCGKIGGGGYFTKCGLVHHLINNWISLDLRFCKNEGSKRFQINVKWVKWIEN